MKHGARWVQVLLATIAIPILVNLISSNLVEEDIVPASTSIAILVIAVLVLATIEYRIRRFTPTVPDLGFRSYLIRIVQARGVSPYLEQLQRHPLIDVSLTSESKVVTRFDRFPSPQDSTQISLRDLFEGLPTRFLLLGGPGFGKSILMAKTAQELLVRATLSDGAPIPVLLNLASWNRYQGREGQRFEDWVGSEIIRIYGRPVLPVPGRFDRWIRSQISEASFALLLDGFDEVPPSQQTECVRQINQFIDSDIARAHIVVSSRSEDYRTALSQVGAVPLRLEVAFEVAPLNRSIVAANLPEAVDILTTIEKDPTGPLARVLAAPLFLDLARQLNDPSDLIDCESARSMRRVLLESLVNRSLAASNRPQSWSREQLLQVLVNLARFLEQGPHDSAVFLPEDVLDSSTTSNAARSLLAVGSTAIAAIWATFSFLVAVVLYYARSLDSPADVGASVPNPIWWAISGAIGAIVLASGRAPHFPSVRSGSEPEKIRSGIIAGFSYVVPTTVAAGLFTSHSLAVVYVVATIPVASIAVISDWIDSRQLTVAIGRRFLPALKWLPSDLEEFIQWGTTSGLLRPAAGRGLSFRHREIREMLAEWNLPK